MSSTIPTSSENPLHPQVKEDGANSKVKESERLARNDEERAQIYARKESIRKSFDPVLLNRLRAQIEFYFSPQNLSRDTYLRSLLMYKFYPTGAAPLLIIASFPKVRSLCAGDLPVNIAPPADAALVARSLDGSEVVAVSPDNAWIICLFPTPPLLPMTRQRIKLPAQRFVQSARETIPSNTKKIDMNEKGNRESTLGGLVEQTSQLQISASKERTTVILRDIPEECDVDKVLAAFTTDKVKPKAARPDIGKSWYVLFSSEADAVAAVFACQGKEIDGHPVRARVKSEPSRSKESSKPSTPIGSVASTLSVPESMFSGGTSGSNNNHLQPPAPSVGLQVNRPTHVHPPNYPHYPHAVETQPYASQQQQIYQPHYGMPLHVMQNRHTSLPPPNYSFPPHMQPYIHHGNPVPYPTQQHGPYFINNAMGSDITSNLLPQPHPRENFQRTDHRFTTTQRNAYVGTHTGGNVNLNFHNESRNNQLKVAPNNQIHMNIMDQNMNQRHGLNSKAHPILSGVATPSNHHNLDSSKFSDRDNSQQKKQKNASQQNRGGANTKSDGYNNNYQALSENGMKSNSSNYNGKNKGKNRKNRKNNNGNNNEGGQNNIGSNNNAGKTVTKEVIVMNTLNFPELKTDKGSKSNDGKTELSSSSNNGANGDDISAPSNQLTGYAAALRQKRSKVFVHEKEKNVSSMNDGQS